jgi:hypothetical protein
MKLPSVLVPLAMAAATGAVTATGDDWPVRLVDVASEAGLTAPSIYGGVESKRFIIETNGAGAAWVDVDEDGWADALVLGGTRLEPGTRREVAKPDFGPTTRLYRNRGDGTFTDITEASGLGRTAWASSVCAGDYDGDGAVDLHVTAYGTNVLYRNRGGGRFEDRTASAGLPASGVRWGSGCSFLDYDRDGDADLFVANYLVIDLATASEPGQGVNCLWKGIPVNCGPKGLPTDTNLLYRNRGDGTFEDVSEASGIARVRNRYPMTALAADFTDDGWIDLYVASDSTAAILYRNNRDGTFTDVAVASGAAFNENGMAQAGMGAAAGDIDADGRLDLVKTHFADDIPALYRALGGGLFEEIATAAGLAVQNRHVEWGAGLYDFDNDGLQDLLYVTGNVYPEIERALPRYPHAGPRVVFRNRGERIFEDVTDRSGPGPLDVRSSRGAAFGDYDNDGDVDVLIMNMNEPPSLLRNDYGGANRWLRVTLEGTASNRDGYGATVRVTAGGRTQARALLSQGSYYSHDDRRLHFGVGAAETVDVEVQWPSGRRDVVRRVGTNREIRVREAQGLVP